MKIEELVWSDDLNLGIDQIDKAHQELFRVVRRIANLLQSNDKEKNKFACEQAIKYLLDYTLWHFKDEEEYQKQIGYPGYKFHKHLHDNLREVVLPSLKKNFEEKDYNNESISRFVYIIAGWLTGHIMIEDMAMVGKTKTKWSVTANPQEKIQIINTELTSFMKRIFSIDISLCNAYYEAEPLIKPSCYQMTFEDDSNHVVTMTMIATESMILAIVSAIVAMEITKTDKNVYQTYIQVAQKYAFQILGIFYPGMNFKRTSHKYLSLVDIQYEFKDKLPQYSLLWEAKQGHMGFCLNSNVTENNAKE